MRPAAAPSLDGEWQDVFTIVVGGARWALPATGVQTVFRIGPLTPVPLAPPVIAGLINLRGRVVVALDLAIRLGCARPADGAARAQPGDLAVAAEHGGEVLALLVESVGEVLPLRLEDCVPPPANMPAHLEPLTAGWFRDAGTIVPLLNVERLFGPEGDGRSGRERHSDRP